MRLPTNQDQQEIMTSPQLNNFGRLDYLQAFLNQNEQWITSRLGCGLNNLCVDFLDGALPGDADKALTAVYSDQEGFPDSYRMRDIETKRKFDRASLSSHVELSSVWLSPQLLKIPDSDVCFVYHKLTYSHGTYYTVASPAYVVIYRSEDAKAITNYIIASKEETFRKIANYKPKLTTFNAADTQFTQTLPASNWERLTSSVSAQDLKRDICAFHSNYKWYTENNVSYRRGYLLYGPPGNGKSSCARVIGSQCEMDIYTLNFGSDKADDATLSKMFDTAGCHVPSLVLMEDIDRLFGRSRQTKTNVTFQHLLNSLDGVGTPEGVVVIATANHPDEMDASIIKRPGRFHRIIGFNNPTAFERKAYFECVMPDLGELHSSTLATATTGFSYAQLNESWVQAALESYNIGGTERKIAVDDLKKSINVIRESYLDLKEKRHDKAGFVARAAA